MGDHGEQRPIDGLDLVASVQRILGNPPQLGLGYTEGRNIKIMPTRYHFREYAVAAGLASYGV